MATDLLAKHCAVLSPTERFRLTIEAMARGDHPDAVRLEDTTPQVKYQGDDIEFRDRMRRAFTLATLACLQMRGPLAQLRMARTFRETCREFGGGVVTVAKAAFLAGRAYGRREATPAAAGVEGTVVPSAKEIVAEVAADGELRGELEEVGGVAEESVDAMADLLVAATAKLHAGELLAQGEGFGAFCRATLNIEPDVLMAAFGLRDVDPTNEVMACTAGMVAGDAAVRDWEEFWVVRWERRFS